MKDLERDPDLEALLEHMRDVRGFDFTGYKRGSLARRIAKRMGEVKIPTARDYRDHLEANPTEFVSLFNTILINVTDFFRDNEAWGYVENEIVPRILASKKDGEQIRVWSAGCASGQEAYTLAIILAEILGPNDFKDRVKIYATDVDEEALAYGRRGSYLPKELENVSAELQSKWFRTNGERATLTPELRHAVVFGRQDLVQDSPISRVDLLVCRNVLMYFTSETQTAIIERMHFAIKDEGFLFLGRSEMLFSGRHFFAPDHVKHRVFTKIVEADASLRRTPIADGGSDELLRRHLQDEALDAARAVQIVIDSFGLVVSINEMARRTFGLDRRDIGRALHDLEVSYRPIDLRSLIDEVRAEGRSIEVPSIERRLPDGAWQYFDLSVSPVRDEAGVLVGTIVTFTDVTYAMRLRKDLEYAQHELVTAYEELQATNEEVETTNEELQSTVEELETTNEELQSTNEELETMNEELQSTNEELQTVNDELRERTDDLNRTSAFTEAVLSSLPSAVAVVDENLVIRSWSSRATSLWGVRTEEAVGTELVKLDWGVPVDKIIDPIRACIASGEAPPPVEVDAVDRRGRTVRARFGCSSMSYPEGAKGAVIVMEIVA